MTPHGRGLTLNERAAVLGADYAFARATNIPRATAEHAVVSTPPLCMFRHGLWGGAQHFMRNLPEAGRAGGQVTFGSEGERRDSIYSWVGRTTKVPTSVEFPPRRDAANNGGG